VELPIEGEYPLWDGLSREIAGEMRGSLPGGRLAYYVLVPARDGIGVLGLTDALVPMPRGLLSHVKWNDGWHVELRREIPALAVVSQHQVCARTASGRELPIRQHANLWTIDTTGMTTGIHIYRR